MDAQAPLVEPVVRRSLADLAYDKLHLAVIDGALTPGQRLSDATLAGQLGMSRAPVREAISRLESAGLVSSKAGYGWSVIEFSDADIEEIYSLRASYEAFAAERAASGFLPRSSRRSTISSAKWMKNRLTDAWRNVLKIDMQFHEEMVRAADHVRLLYSWQRLRDQIILVAGLTAQLLYRDLRDARRHHEPLLEALRTNDAKSATDDCARARPLRAQASYETAGIRLTIVLCRRDDRSAHEDQNTDDRDDANRRRSAETHLRNRPVACAMIPVKIGAKSASAFEHTPVSPKRSPAYFGLGMTSFASAMLVVNVQLEPDKVIASNSEDDPEIVDDGNEKNRA